MSMMRWFFWLALGLSLLLHFGVLAAEPLYAWLNEKPAAEVKVKKTTRKLQSQQLDDDSAEVLKNIKPVESQVVFLQAAAEPVVAAPVASPAPTKTPKMVASAAIASTITSAPSQTSQPDRAAASKVASAVASMVAKEAASSVAAALSASSVASAASSVTPASSVAKAVASKASKAARAATKINHAAAKRFPREVLIEYRYAVMSAFLNWKVVNGAYELELKVIPAGIRYISRGRVGKDGVMPDYFADMSNGPDKPKNEVQFDWATMQATITNKGQQTIEPFEAGDQDALSAALHLVLMGNSQPEYSMSVFTGKKRYPNIHYAIKGESTIQIGGHPITALLMAADGKSNQGDFWLAPDWNNLPVRMVINTEKYGRFDLSAYNLTLDGKKVLERVDADPRAQQRR